jgi:hypothetical protein
MAQASTTRQQTEAEAARGAEPRLWEIGAVIGACDDSFDTMLDVLAAMQADLPPAGEAPARRL